MIKKIMLNVWRLAYPLMIYLLVAVIVENIFLLVIAKDMVGPLYDSMTDEEFKNALIDELNANGLTITAIYNGVLIPIFILLMKLDEKRRLLSGGIKYKLPNAPEFLLIFIFGSSAAIAINFIISLSGLALLSPKYQEVSEIIYSENVYLQIFSAAIVAPVLEELFFRGLIFKRLRKDCGVILSIAVSSLFFGIFHGNLVQFVYASILGALLAYSYEKYKTILVPIIFHIGANMLAVIFTNAITEQNSIFVMCLGMPIGTLLAVLIFKHMINYKAQPVSEPVLDKVGESLEE